MLGAHYTCLVGLPPGTMARSMVMHLTADSGQRTSRTYILTVRASYHRRELAAGSCCVADSQAQRSPSLRNLGQRRVIPIPMHRYLSATCPMSHVHVRVRVPLCSCAPAPAPPAPPSCSRFTRNSALQSSPSAPHSGTLDRSGAATSEGSYLLYTGRWRTRATRYRYPTGV